MFGMTIRNNNRGMNPYNPFREMEALERAFFGDPFGRFFDTPAFPQLRTDVTDEGDHFLLQADLPGFDKKDIQLELQDNTLTVQAQRRCETEQKDRADRVIRMERSYGSYKRSFDITGIDADGIKAKYHNGVLSLMLPKKEKDVPQARRLEIE